MIGFIWISSLVGVYAEGALTETKDTTSESYEVIIIEVRSAEPDSFPYIQQAFGELSRVPIPEPTSPDRTNCEAIRGSEYQSDNERVFYLEKCRLTIKSAPQAKPNTQIFAPIVPSSSHLERIKMCESGGNYAVVDSTGTYYGAYQFDLQTWRGVGGVGLPNQASPEEQDYRAQLLYGQRGSAPWPVCQYR